MPLMKVRVFFYFLTFFMILMNTAPAFRLCYRSSRLILQNTVSHLQSFNNYPEGLPNTNRRNKQAMNYPPLVAFKDTSTECAICLAAFDESTDDEETIVLTCGHRWHLVCLKEQLEHAQPNHARRLLFSGCRCAKCGVFCDHESLRHLTRQTDALRGKVDALVREQLQVDAPEKWKNAASDKPKLVEEGWRNYAFYLCNSCEEPYFGGTVECADQEEGELPSEDRLCPSCAPQPHILCLHPLEHRGFHVWKCRYCCQPSTYVCYGTVHFCTSCHYRNSERVQRRRPARGQGPPSLEAISCPGGDKCSFPKRRGRDSHQNGSTPSCEQVYHCAICVSNPSRHAFIIEPGSRNFILNPSGDLGRQHWQQLNGSSHWKVETSEIPVNETTATNFVSNFQWCIMGQTVQIHHFVNDPSSVRIEVSAKFMGRTDCPSVFRMEAILFDAQRRQIHREHTPELDAPADFWERASLILEPTCGAHSVVMVIYGKDRRFWQGNFGSKVAECSVRVLCDEEELDTVLRQEPPAEARRDLGRVRWGLEGTYFDILLPVVLALIVWFATQ